MLTDFGCDYFFARAVGSVQERYGFVLGASTVRTATLKHAHRARARLQLEYDQSFRALPWVGAAHMIAEVDGTMICTVPAGRKRGKRPRQL